MRWSTSRRAGGELGGVGCRKAGACLYFVSTGVSKGGETCGSMDMRGNPWKDRGDIVLWLSAPVFTVS